MLDYMSLSLNLPLDYHPHTSFSTKYTKTMRDLLLIRRHLMIVGGKGASSAGTVNEAES
jgi:hypothetical protein